MFEKIVEEDILSLLDSKLSNLEKIERLKLFMSSKSFLTTLCNPTIILHKLAKFSREVFTEHPPDSAITFGPSNDARVFLIRLLSKFHYTLKDEGSIEVLEICHDLLCTENIFNRYLTLKLLYSIDSEVVLHVGLSRHLEIINTFFIKELPGSTEHDNSRQELGFFAAAEALNYLIKLSKCIKADYSFIFSTIAETLKFYISTNFIDIYKQNRKIVCEFSSFSINFLDFALITNTADEYIADLCLYLFNIVPLDCPFLIKNTIRVIVLYVKNKKHLFINTERFFQRNLFHIVFHRNEPVFLDLLTEIMAIYSRNMPKTIFKDYDLKIMDLYKFSQNPVCIMHLLSNTLNAVKFNSDLESLRLFIVKQISNAFEIYKTIHSKKISSFDFSSVQFNHASNQSNNISNQPNYNNQDHIQSNYKSQDCSYNNSQGYNQLGHKNDLIKDNENKQSDNCKADKHNNEQLFYFLSTI